MKQQQQQQQNPQLSLIMLLSLSKICKINSIYLFTYMITINLLKLFYNLTANFLKSIRLQSKSGLGSVQEPYWVELIILLFISKHNTQLERCIESIEIRKKVKIYK